MMRTGLRLIAAVALAGLIACGGCPQTTPATIEIVAGGPSSVVAGDTVELSAEVSGASSTSGYTYQWSQTYGRPVSLSSKTAANPTFVAADNLLNTIVSFRVDVTAPDGKLYASNEVTVSIGSANANSNNNANSNTNANGSSNNGKVRVRMVTSLGNIVVDLDQTKAPISTANFLQYVDAGFYTNTIFHRVIADFVIQGGGFTSDLMQKQTQAPITLESNNGLSNSRGTIAMARTNDPNSGTSQFYFNLKDNTDLDRTATNPGYAVFGAIVEGLDVMDAIGAVQTTTRSGFQDVPVNTVFIQRVERVP